MASENVQIDFRIYSIIFRYNDSESAKAVLQNRKAFLYMVFSVHTKLCSTSSGCYNNGLVCSGFYECCSLDQSVGRSCTESTCIGTGCRYKSCYLSCSFCEVTAASLVHITTRFLRTVDDIFHVLFVDARVADCI